MMKDTFHKKKIFASDQYTPRGIYPKKCEIKINTRKLKKKLTTSPTTIRLKVRFIKKDLCKRKETCSRTNQGTGGLCRGEIPLCEPGDS